MAQKHHRGDLPDLFVPIPARLSAKQRVTASEQLLTFCRQDGRSVGHVPGQFLQVSIFGLEEAPISICSAPADDGSFQLCVRCVGRVTRALHELKIGQQVGIRGPLGRGFPLEDLERKDLVFIAGGIGLAPMRSLIQWCLACRERFGRITLLHGAKRPAELLFRQEFPQWSQARDVTVRVIVDVGDNRWKGPVGLITELVSALQLDPQKTAVVVVGPSVMYRPVIDRLLAKGVRPDWITLSLERQMRCGVGTCGHCMIDTLYCCRDGPVFRLSELTDIRGAI